MVAEPLGPLGQSFFGARVTGWTRCIQAVERGGQVACRETGRFAAQAWLLAEPIRSVELPTIDLRQASRAPGSGAGGWTVPGLGGGSYFREAGAMSTSRKFRTEASERAVRLGQASEDRQRGERSREHCRGVAGHGSGTRGQ